MLAVGRGEIPTRPTADECLTEPTDAIWSLIQHCWQREPGARPSMPCMMQQLSIVDMFVPTRAAHHLPKHTSERRCTVRDHTLFNSLCSGIRLPTMKPETEEPTSLIPVLRTASSRIGVVACDFCRSRQMQCDGMQPTCTPCQRRQLPCSLRYLAVIPCDACRESGIACDCVHPTCSSCAGKNLPCKYMNDPNPNTSGDVTGAHQLLSQRGAPEVSWCSDWIAESVTYSCSDTSF
jgi:hypothetical protein